MYSISSPQYLIKRLNSKEEYGGGFHIHVPSPCVPRWWAQLLILLSTHDLPSWEPPLPA